LSGNKSSAIAEIFSSNSSRVGASAAAGISSQCPLQTNACWSQAAEIVKMTGLDIASPRFAATPLKAGRPIRHITNPAQYPPFKPRNGPLLARPRLTGPSNRSVTTPGGNAACGSRLTRSRPPTTMAAWTRRDGKPVAKRAEAEVLDPEGKACASAKANRGWVGWARF
jgi:hypothetical protein